jgi:hypothetical protein
VEKKKNMKIALCLHGYFNSSRDLTSFGVDGFDHIKKHILSDNVDVYIHTWDTVNESKIKQLYGPWIKNILVEEQIDFKPLFYRNNLHTLESRPGVTPFWNAFSQFYSVSESFKLMIQSNIDYDVVIKSRFDLGRINRNSSGPGLCNPFPVQCINFQPHLPMNKFYMADWQYLDTEGPADMWFYSGIDLMKNFSKLYDIISEDVRVGSEYSEWCGPEDGGMLNIIKAWKWFLLRTDLWSKKQTLQTYWE